MISRKLLAPRMKASPLVFVFRFKDSLEANVVTVVAIHSDHRVSTYRLRTLSEPSSRLRHQRRPGGPDGDEAAAAERRRSRAEAVKDSSILEGMESDCVFVTPVKDGPDLQYHLFVLQRRRFYAPRWLVLPR